MISANGGLPAQRYTPQVTPRWPRGSEPASELPMPPVKTGDSPQLVKILARRRVGSKKRRTLLYCFEWDVHTWSWGSSKALEEDPVYLEFLRLRPE